MQPTSAVPHPRRLLLAAVFAAALCLVAMGAVAPLAQARKISVTHNTLLGPATASNPVGTNHTLTATVLMHTENCDPYGPPPSSLPESGVTVKFEVTTGPNQGLTGSGVTNVQGKATFTYTSLVTGTDKLVATPVGLKNTGVCNIDAGAALPSKAVEAIWIPRAAPKITINDVTVEEGNTVLSPATPATFTVSLSKASAVPVTVDYATADGTAQAPADYVPEHEKVTFAPGDPLTKTVTIDVVGDHLEEAPTETFQVNLSNATNAQIADPQGIGTIVDDDGLIMPWSPLAQHDRRGAASAPLRRHEGTTARPPGKGRVGRRRTHAAMSQSRMLVVAAVIGGALYLVGAIALGSAPKAGDSPAQVAAWFHDHQDAARTYAWTAALGMLAFAVMAGVIRGCCRGRPATSSCSARPRSSSRPPSRPGSGPASRSTPARSRPKPPAPCSTWRSSGARS